MSSTISRTDLHPMINELSSSTNTMHNQQNKPAIHDKPLSLILSLRINESLQNIPSLISTVLKTHHTSQISDEPSTIFHSTADELNTLHKISQAINKTIENELDTNIPLTIGMQDSIPISSAKQLEISERRKQRYKRQREIISIAKRALKPAFKQREITKEEYKKIMKKVVTKATYSNKTDQKWISRMTDAYVNKYRSL